MVEGGFWATRPRHASVNCRPSASSYYEGARRWATVTVRMGAFLVCIGALAACGSRQAQPVARPQPTSPVTRISVQAAVRAMQDDVFFATYNGATLLIRGTVSSVTRHGRTTTLMLGSRKGRVQCDLGSRPSPVLVGHAITVEVPNPQQNVSRAPDGLTISPCRPA